MKLDPQLVEIFTWVSSGAALGTLWRALTRPEPNVTEWLIQSFVALTVGIIIGCAATQYFSLTGFVSTAAGAVCSFLSEEVLRGLRVRGRGIQKGQIDLSLQGKGDDHE